MGIKRKDFQKAAAFIHEFLLKLHEDSECAELRDSLNLALLHMQKYYRLLQNRSHEKSTAHTLSLTARGLSPMTPFVDAPDKFQWKWINLDSTRLLVSMGVPEESMNISMLPPIIQASKQGNVDLIRELINQDPSCADDQDGLGRTAVCYAVHFNQLDSLQCLLENEANVNTLAHDGSTAIHLACHDANADGLAILLQNGGDFTIADNHGRCPIHWACTTYSTECLEMLINHYADVNTRDKDGLTPSMWACRMDNIEHFQLLCQSPNFRVDEPDGIERDFIGRTWMHWSVRRMEPLECLQTLLTTETAAIRDQEGRTLLLTAAEMGSLPSCRVILEIGSRRCLQDRDNQNRNALHLAAIGGHGDVVNFLLENGVDLNAVDKFNASPWDYTRNRQLHYCQLIIMSHQRQRLASNPTSPVPSGLGLMLGSNVFMNGDMNGAGDYDYASTRGSVDSMPITPPHPPKRPRTGRLPVRRSRSLTSQDRERDRSPHFSMEERDVSSAGDNLPRKNQRIEVSVNTRKTALEGYSVGDREEVAMDHEEDELDGVSVGGMDVSDIEDDDVHIPHAAARGPGPPQLRQPAPLGAPQRPPGPQPNFQPRPPPRYSYQPRPPAPSQFGQPLAQYRNKPDYADESQSYDVQPNKSPGRVIAPSNQRVTSGYFNSRNQATTTSSDSYPSPNRPKPAPRPPRLQQAPKPPPRRTPSPVNRPGSGSMSRDQITSPPMSGMESPVNKDRPDSAGRPPGVLEGKKLLPPPMLVPLENAPKPPNLEERQRKKKKKKRDRGGRETEKDKERERDLKSPPEDLTPPRGYAAPLHPPPSATTRQQRAQSGIPSPKFSKGAPQKHESRYVEENMEEEKIDDKPPAVNGMAVPIRDAPVGSARPTQRMNQMDSDEYDPGMVNSEGFMDDAINEDEEVGPLIPPPQGFRGPSASRPGQGRPLSQSVPQDSKSSARGPSASAKPPLPRARNSASFNTRYKNPSPPRRPSRPPTGRNGEHSSS